MNIVSEKGMCPVIGINFSKFFQSVWIIETTKHVIPDAIFTQIYDLAGKMSDLESMNRELGKRPHGVQI